MSAARARDDLVSTTTFPCEKPHGRGKQSRELLFPELRRIQSRMRRLCLALVLALTFPFIAAKTSAKVPSVTMSCAAEFDAACSQQTKYQINPAWIEELK